MGHELISRVFAVIVALEEYRKPPSGDPLPNVSFAHADADAFEVTVNEIFQDMPSDDVNVLTIKDSAASLTAISEELRYTIRNLAEDDLFIFYYAGHGFHGASGNRLSAFDTNSTNIESTTLSMRDNLLEPLSNSNCRKALVFVDACAAEFKQIVDSRDVITNLETDEVEAFLDSGWYLGVFLSFSPGEKSYPSKILGHGIWTYFLLEALSGRADRALMRNRWLTDVSLRDYLRDEVPRFITKETNIRGSQTPQAILNGSNTFRIHHVPKPPAVPSDAALAGIKLRNQSEYLEEIETGPIRRLDGFKRGNTVPTDINDYADRWCQRLLADQVAEELQTLYSKARTVLNARRKDLRKKEGDGAGTLDAPAFRYTIETGQNPNDPAKYCLNRRLELRQGWSAHRAAIDELFGNKFDRFVIEFENMNIKFDDLVELLEDISDEQGGDVDDDDRHLRVVYRRDEVTFTFDLQTQRLEISFGQKGTLKLVDAVQQFQFGNERPSPMLVAASSHSENKLGPVK